MNARVVIDAQFQAEAAQLRPTAPIVPSGTAASRALMGVIAVMAFVAALAIGAVHLVQGAAAQWRADVGREITLEVRPAEGRNIEADVARAMQIAGQSRGVASAQVYGKDEMAKLVSPWLGSGVDPANLPLPRLIVVRLDGSEANLAALRTALAKDVPNASLDEGSRWSAELAAAADTVLTAGTTLLALVLLATILSVTVATRGAVAANRPVVELLHVVGARDQFVAGEFQRHFLALGANGGLIGGGAAALLFAAAGIAAALMSGPAAGVLAGSLILDSRGYAGISGVALTVIAVTALASRLTVRHTLKHIH
jgi:cell division transport system permease protein